MLDPEKQLAIIKKDSIDCIPETELLKKLKKNIPLKIKLGADPSAPDLHLGHTVILRKLKQFQDLGHEIIFIIGDFTAMIGDPSGKNETRKILSRDEVLKNAETYQSQVFKILDPTKTKIRFNSEWLMKLDFSDILKLTATTTVAQLLERDDFAKRFSEHRPISLIEFMYPLAQAYDSVAINADVELGGTDQKFNLLFGRSLQQSLGLEPQVILTMPIIEGTDGTQKMSKSLNNYVGIFETPENMFGKIMSIPDGLIVKYFKLLTDKSEESIQKRLNNGENPRDLKSELAQNIIIQYYSLLDAEKAMKHFNNIFRNKAVPEKMPEYFLKSPYKQLEDFYKTIDIKVAEEFLIQKEEIYNCEPLQILKDFQEKSKKIFKKIEIRNWDEQYQEIKEIVAQYQSEAEKSCSTLFFLEKIINFQTFKLVYTLVDIIEKSGFESSKSAVRRLIHQGAVSIDSEKITTDIILSHIKKSQYVIKVGKFKFLRVITQ